MKNLRVLLIDDLEMIRTMLRKSLNTLGIQRIDEAEDGSQGLQKIQQAHAAGDPYQVVFCDWMMPKMNGIEVLETCRADAKFGDLCFVMVTSESEQALVIRAVIAGASDYLVKPFSAEAIEKKITKILSKLMKSAA